jgi:hypothetical protein
MKWDIQQRPFARLRRLWELHSWQYNACPRRLSSEKKDRNGIIRKRIGLLEQTVAPAKNAGGLLPRTSH